MHQMWIYTQEITGQHLARNAITAMTQAISLSYVGSPTLTESSTEHLGTAVDDPALTQKDVKG